MTHDSSQPPLILAIDDIETNLRLVKGFLRAAKVEVQTATSAEAGLELVAQQPPDLILLDIMMPGMSGFEMLEVLRADDKTRHIPVIMLSALSDIEDKIRGQEAGADDFVTKPFDRTELVLRVKSMLRLKSMHDQLAIKVAELEVAKTQLRELAEYDDLTGLLNKRAFNIAASKELERAKRLGRQFSLLMMDLDFFKEVNDTYGHPTGDHVLRTVGELLRTHTRGIDPVGRYGGEEFVHMMIEADRGIAAQVANKHRERIEAYPFTDEHGRPIGKKTVSIGVAAFPVDGTTVEQVFKAADQRLYLAKQRGRNRVVSEPEPATVTVEG